MFWVLGSAYLLVILKGLQYLQVLSSWVTTCRQAWWSGWDGADLCNQQSTFWTTISSSAGSALTSCGAGARSSVFSRMSLKKAIKHFRFVGHYPSVCVSNKWHLQDQSRWKSELPTIISVCLISLKRREPDACSGSRTTSTRQVGQKIFGKWWRNI